MEYIARAGGSDIARTLHRGAAVDVPLARLVRPQPTTERMARWTHRPPFWGEPLRNHGLDLATATFPDLLYRRLDQLGIDFTVLYPDHRHQPAGVRRRRRAPRVLSRSQRLLRRPLDGSPRPHDAGGDHPDGHARGGDRRARATRCTRPRLQGGDAAELREAAARARVGGGPTRSASTASTTTTRCGRSAATSASCRAFHGPGEGSTFHDSISNPVYNHVGHFATAATAVCKSLFLGGVSQRFPELRFLFLEGGVGWARSLLADLTSHWEKRSLDGLARDSDPRLADADLFLDLYQQYGGIAVAADDHADELAQAVGRPPRGPERQLRRPAGRDRGRAATALRRALLLRVRGRRSGDCRRRSTSRRNPGAHAAARDRSARTSATGTSR